jgi:hypothetical protein
MISLSNLYELLFRLLVFQLTKKYYKNKLYNKIIIVNNNSFDMNNKIKIHNDINKDFSQNISVNNNATKYILGSNNNTFCNIIFPMKNISLRSDQS